MSVLMCGPWVYMYLYTNYRLYILPYRLNRLFVHCILHNVQSAVYIVPSTLYIQQYTLYIVHCTLYSVYCTLHIVHYMVYGVDTYTLRTGKE